MLQFFKLKNADICKVNCKANTITIMQKNKNKPLYCKNLFLCAGVISSSKILINSFENLKLEVKESSYFIMPCIFLNKKKIDLKPNWFFFSLNIFNIDKLYSIPLNLYYLTW